MMVIYGKIAQNAAEKWYNFVGETNFLHRTGIYSLCAVQDADGAKEIPNSWLSYINSMV